VVCIVGKRTGALVTTVAAMLVSGCGMCQDCFDMAPPVVDSPVDTGDLSAAGRSGSVLTGPPMVVPADDDVVYE